MCDQALHLIPKDSKGEVGVMVAQKTKSDSNIASKQQILLGMNNNMINSRNILNVLTNNRNLF